MKMAVVTLFPEMLSAVTDYGITGRAVEAGLLKVEAVNPRTFAGDRHQTVDDRPFGGGPGMVMKIEPLRAALRQAREDLGRPARTIYLAPHGQRLTQARVEALAAEEALVLLAGRYEGVDERLIEAEVNETVSIGDYVLSGGELPAMVLMDAVTRRLAGVLGHEDSAEQDSFTGELEGLLDCPHYTRPEEVDGVTVPAVLLSGHHEHIRRWRLKQSLGRTWLWRPDLLEARRRGRGLDAEAEQLLAEFIREHEARQDDTDSTGAGSHERQEPSDSGN
jgi:tRNA (guanine37-N1)-methyltransferase